MSGQDNYQQIECDDLPGPMKSIEGWILIIRGVHEEAQEEDIYDAFSKYGPIKNLNLNLDRRSGYVKGYALIEYEQFDQANEALKAKVQIIGQNVTIDWAFKKPPKKKK